MVITYLSLSLSLSSFLVPPRLAERRFTLDFVSLSLSLSLALSLFVPFLRLASPSGAIAPGSP